MSVIQCDLLNSTSKLAGYCRGHQKYCCSYSQSAFSGGHPSRDDDASI